MTESSKEPVIGRRVGITFSKLPDMVSAPPPLERAQIGVQNVIGGERVIDTSHNNYPHPREAMKGRENIQDVINLLEPLVPQPDRLRIQEMVARFIDNSEDHSNPIAEIREKLEDPTDREYAAAIYARYKTTHEGGNSGEQQQPNRDAYKVYEENVKKIFGPQNPQPA